MTLVQVFLTLRLWDRSLMTWSSRPPPHTSGRESSAPKPRVPSPIPKLSFWRLRCHQEICKEGKLKLQTFCIFNQQPFREEQLQRMEDAKNSCQLLMIKEPLIQTIEMRALMIIWWERRCDGQGQKWILYSSCTPSFPPKLTVNEIFSYMHWKEQEGKKHCVQFLVNLKHSLSKQCNRYLHSAQCTSSASGSLGKGVTV